MRAMSRAGLYYDKLGSRVSEIYGQNLIEVVACTKKRKQVTDVVKELTELGGGDAGAWWLSSGEPITYLSTILSLHTLYSLLSSLGLTLNIQTPPFTVQKQVVSLGHWEIPLPN